MMFCHLLSEFEILWSPQNGQTYFKRVLSRVHVDNDQKFHSNQRLYWYALIPNLHRSPEDVVWLKIEGKIEILRQTKCKAISTCEKMTRSTKRDTHGENTHNADTKHHGYILCTSQLISGNKTSYSSTDGSARISSKKTCKACNVHLSPRQTLVNCSPHTSQACTSCVL